MVTKHAQENWKLHAKHLTIEQRKSVMVLVAKAESVNGSVAIVAEIAPTENAHRDDWALNDRFVVIVRNQVVKTVMLSRKNQINKGHLRTSQIWVAA